MIQDFRYAFRHLRRRPLVTAVAVITLGLGIGGASAVFSVVNAVLLRPLPFADPDRLVRIWELTRDGDRFSVSAPNYLDLAAASRTLSHVAAFNETRASAVLTEGDEPQRIVAVPITASLIDVLGVTPAIGRMFREDETRPGAAERRVVLADGLWRRRFGADPAIVGRVITLDDQRFIVSGVMPPPFDFPGGADAWVPLVANPQSDRGDKELSVIGRLAPGVTLAQLQDDLRQSARRIAEAHPESNAGWSAAAAPFSEWIVAPRFRDAVWVLFGAVGMLLLLACANVANLLIAAASTRQAEIRIRAAIGASRGRVMRQLFTEAALMAALGTLAGVLLASWSVDAVVAIGSGRIPRLEGLRIDGSVLAFACLAGAASCLAFGLAPALHAARVDLRSAMDHVRVTAGNRRLRQGLVVVEVALAVLLVVSAGLMANSFVRLVNVDPGFDSDGTIAMPIELPPARYPEERVAPFYEALLDRVRAVPGVVAAGATSTNPFRQFGFSNSVTPEEQAASAPPSGLVQAGWRSVTPGFFEAMGIPLRSGRTFGAADRPGGERVVIVSESLARRLWPGETAVGKRIYWGGTTGRTRTVIGVSGDIRDVQLDAEPTPMVFLPHMQVDLPSMTLVVRTPGALAMGGAMRDVLRQMDPTLPAPPIHAIDVSRAEGAAGPRFNLSLLGAFASLALVLALTGVYAMLAFTVSEQRREIAVRLALGASAPRIAGEVLRNGLGPAVAGIAVGTGAALGVTRVMSNLLYGVTPTDPLTFFAVVAGLLAVSVLACYLPARQASRVNPVDILRQ